MSRLRVYTVHIDPSLPHPYEEASFIEEGFNWKAFIFASIWALYHRMWLLGGIIIGVDCLIGLLSMDGLSSTGVICMQLAWRLVIGYAGNDWIRKKLKRKGYVMADIVTGDSQLRAEQRFFDRYFASDKMAFVS
ncbi:MAG TPA: DUF2628 domain-containing protein [Rickettsiales bacterium]|nr:DUF2628 domain-containing protein [Rickettsiales bacterium]